MIAFFINLAMLVQTLWQGLRKDAEIRALAVLLGVLLAGGTVFSSQVEDWSILDALYFCVMTITTVGYGDLTPTSALSKGFTIGFVILGIGVFASFVAKLVAPGWIFTRKPWRSGSVETPGMGFDVDCRNPASRRHFHPSAILVCLARCAPMVMAME